MAEPVTMKRAGMLADDKLLIEFSDGKAIELNTQQILSLHPESANVQNPGEPATQEPSS